MNTSHCLGLHGFVLLLVLFHSYVFVLASYNARGIKINRDQKRFLSNANHNPRNDTRESPQHGKEYEVCTYPEPDPVPLTIFHCKNGFVVTKINFADYGNPIGTCKNFRHGNCGAPDTLRLVKENCLGKQRCILYITDEMFGPSHCKGVARLAVKAICGKT